MVFSQQVTSDEQDPVHDIYRMPESLWELFGVIKDALYEPGYRIGTNGAQEIEMYNHAAGLAYAYVPVENYE